MSTPIEFADIKTGDTIKACGMSDGVAMDRQGVVDKAEIRQGTRTISTPENGWIYHSQWSGDWFFELIERPEPVHAVLGSVYTPEFSIVVKPKGDNVGLEMLHSGSGITVNRAELLAAIS